MEDVCADLSSFSFQAGLSDEEKRVVYLRARSAGLTLCGCAHAGFFCKLVQSLRCVMRSHGAERRGRREEQGEELRVGILGMGHLGRQLLLTLLETFRIKASHIKVSTRRPETAAGCIQAGVECFSDNGRLAAWSDVLFLCCLPSHLPNVCAELRSHLSERCLVYSFTSAVPVTRLVQIFGHDFVLKPQYDFVASDAADVWLSCTRPTEALTDPVLIEASCPVVMSGGVSLGLSWVSSVLYSLLNICTSAGLGSGEALSLINTVLQEERPHVVELNTHCFIDAPTLLTKEPFPWISLADAQTKETPLLVFLSSSKSMRECISAAYKSLLETPAK